jgi:MoaD family protein
MRGMEDEMKVKIPAPFLRFTNHQEYLSVEGGTIKELLQQLRAKYPELASVMQTEQGDIVRYVNVFLNGKDIRTIDGIDTSVSEQDQIVILPMLSGG